MPFLFPWNDARNPNPHLFTYIVQPDLLSSMLNVKDAQFQLLTDSLSDASLGEFSYRAPSPKKKKGGGVAALCGRSPIQKKKGGGRGAGKRSHTTMRDASYTVALQITLLSVVAQATILISTFGS